MSARCPHPTDTWPVAPADWDALGACHECGLTMFRLFIRSATWVARRVEKLVFLDDRTVRRQVGAYRVPGGRWRRP